MDDEEGLLNVAELLSIAEDMDLGILSREGGLERLREIVLDGESVTDSDICASVDLREQVTYYIRKYRRQVSLPPSYDGKPCSGDCTSYGCPVPIVVNCSWNIGK